MQHGRHPASASLPRKASRQLNPAFPQRLRWGSSACSMSRKLAVRGVEDNTAPGADQNFLRRLVAIHCCAEVFWCEIDPWEQLARSQQPSGTKLGKQKAINDGQYLSKARRTAVVEVSHGHLSNLKFISPSLRPSMHRDDVNIDSDRRYQHAEVEPPCPGPLGCQAPRIWFLANAPRRQCVQNSRQGGR